MTEHYAMHSFGMVMVTGPRKEALTPKEARTLALQLLRAAEFAEDFRQMQPGPKEPNA